MRRSGSSADSIQAYFRKRKRENILKDEPYAFEHWQRQRSFRRYTDPFDCWVVVLNVFWPVTFVVLAAVGVGLYKKLGQQRHGFPYFRENSNAVEYGLPFTTTSFAIALLLVFRTNESYRRWWDARRNVGRLCTGMRNIVRQGIAWFPTEQNALLQALQRWAIVLPHMMLFHVCEGHDMDCILKPLLLPNELDWIKEQDRPTFGVTACLTRIVQTAKITNEQQQSMDLEIKGGLSEFGASDDILRQPLPVAYTRHTSRFLIIWLLCLPVAIWQVYEWATPVIAGAVAFFLLGIEHIGIMIEEPFSILPIDKIASRLRADIEEMIENNQKAKRLVMECGDQMSPHLPESTQLRLDAARRSSKRHSSLPLPFLSEQNPFMPSPPTELYMAPSAHPLETHPHQNIQIHHGPYQLQSSRPAQVPRAQSLQLERDSAADSAGVGLLSGRRLSAEYDRPAPSKSLRSL
ncbi:hypothetical protein WJX84_001390 [Apatococcus fuscideae]|uniref:Bestrophin homolog n=1 Tax=Apatococcus fuscideae TaxID=2026836 RepID=A0AAW1TD28_9CHLO